MAYFSKFPRIDYDFNNQNLFKLGVNILNRFRIRRNIVNNTSFYFKMQLRDFDRPEIIAHKLYGDPELHWLILMANDMIDPYDDWLKDTLTLENYVSHLYPNSSLFLLTPTIVADTQQNGEVTNQFDDAPIATASSFNVGDTIKNVTSGETATVVKWDVVYSELVIDGNKAGIFNVGDTVQNVSQGGLFNGFVRKVVEDQTSTIHHWEDTDKNIYNPAGKAEETDILLFRDKYIQGVETIQPSSGAFSGKTIRVKTKYGYENDQNEKKRTIKAIRPEYVEGILSDFDRVFS